MEKSESLRLGVVIERRQVDHPWKDHDWRPVGVIPGAPDMDPRGAWKVLRQGEGFVSYHAGTLPMELFRSETESYRINLSQEPPRIFVVLRSNSDPDVDHDLLPFLLTASPFEASHYLDSGEEVVEIVPMPPEVLALVRDFVQAHHVEQVFVKRKRKGVKGKDEPFSRRPPVAARGARRRIAGDRED